MGYYQDVQQQSAKNSGVKLVVGIFLFLFEIFMYLVLRPVIVIMLDSMITPFISIQGLATFGQQIGFMIDGAWLILVILTIVMLIVLPATSHGG